MSRNIESDITLKELFEKINDYSSLLLRSWKSIVATGLIVGVLYGLFHIRDVPKYKAELTFMLNEDQGGALGGITGLLGQFGLGASSSESNLDKILELSKTRKITQQALFEKLTIDAKEDFIANHLIVSLQNQKHWRNSGRLSFLGKGDSLNIDNFLFNHGETTRFTDLENKALKKLHSIITGNSDDGKKQSEGIFSSKYSELTGIMSFSVVSDNQNLSIATVNKFFENLSRYYIEKTTEKQQYDYSIIREKYDSLNNRLGVVQFELASFQDRNFKVFRKQDLLAEKKLKMEEQKLALMLGEAEKQLQLAALTLENKTPYIQLIDAPIKPLRPANKSKIYYFIFGGILGGFLCALWIAVCKMYGDIMNS